MKWKRRNLTWQKTSEGWVTEEQRDGVPDWWISKEAHGWFCKGRTSAMFSGPFKTVTEAKRHAETC